MLKPTRTLLTTALLLSPLPSLLAADAPAKAQKPAPEHRKYELPVEPDENVAYGPHRMQVIYFWRANDYYNYTLHVLEYRRKPDSGLLNFELIHSEMAELVL